MQDFNKSNPKFIQLYKDTAEGKTATADSYKGLPIHAFKGLHGRVGELIADYTAVAKSNVLDIAAGSGALSLRLKDMGASVTSVDIVEENFRPDKSEINFRCMDLNSSFSEQFYERFDVITAIEIIEHLENTRVFIQNCQRLLKPGGVLFLSTPNISSNQAISELICKGTYPYFNEDYYSHGGHITMVPDWLFSLTLNDFGLEVIYKESYGTRPVNFSEWPKLYLTYQLVRLLRLNQTALDGVINIYIITSRQ
ncbi:methyltransferase domain-containing protein [Photobacterium sp. DA100]|uniref:class I SAM-dependent methyltransferase n=1 Tax=Photobacterium sp. DA100 TaxID=3027472 RepID=UPI00247952BC|nr:methyltransferase domain-containing protein [Photobacterium sp. DA100]WEM41654.1 methyltransferase domain-containing protein [Photobacterium sp. DA100]